MLTEPVLTNTREDFGIPAKQQNPLLQSLGKPHVDSFNYMLEGGLLEAVKDLPPVHFHMEKPDKTKALVLLRLDDVTIHTPEVPSGTVGLRDHKIYPSECRQRGSTYKGQLNVRVCWTIDGIEQEPIEKTVGEIPIMVKSNRCNLNNMNPTQLVKHGEHEDEWGGYFILKGHERIVRMLVMTRRNYPVAIKRSVWKARGNLFSDMGVQIRCVRDDNTAVSNVLHYVQDGSAKFTFTYKKNLYYIPIILLLKSMVDVPDKSIYDALLSGCEENHFYKESILNMLREIHEEGLHTTEDCKNYIGQIFRIRFYELPEEISNVDVCDYIMKRCVAIHLDKPEDKFNLLVFMTKKLFRLANNECAAEGVDAVMMQECLLGGHLYLQVLNEKLYTWLCGVRTVLVKRARTQGNKFVLNSQEIAKSMGYTGSIETQMENFLATGNIKSQSGLGLMQSTGFSVIAENINRMRYMSHFKAIHRGSFFMEMRTTEARQLLPDAWGFICPVNTPDGAPCGLLNHLTMNCIITQHPEKEKVNAITPVLIDLGMTALDVAENWKKTYTVMIDGRIVGLIDDDIVTKVVDKLRLLKVEGVKVPKTMEIVLVPKKKAPGQHSGVFIFTGPARMMRPVINLAAGQVELIGTFEQVYMDICIIPEEADENFTHQELTKIAFLSNLASLIPMPDCNQSPRNIYQCQMGKQTMATPTHTWQLQSTVKSYRLQTPNTPLFRPVHYDKISLDDFPMGMNAIVAVISYTGYDMEDAMIINKAAAERGFAHGTIYKSEFIDLRDNKCYFRRNPNNPDLAKFLDEDGLPYPGLQLKMKDPLWCQYSTESGEYYSGSYRGKEDACVDNVRLCNTLQTGIPKRVCVTFRVQRNTTIGDKFASRAGQKGIASQFVPEEDMPFTETGLKPDIIFNPHGFPSRMTIAMMIEVMAGKSGAVHGLVHDATPFRFNEEDTAIEYFGKLLEMGGYNYYGTERMYSGVDGREMKADIFFGVVHYQRLRHMVSDKWQVRSTGAIDVLTRQPVKGRKRGGGVRFGEMERDSLISHGCAYLLQDRLFHCSDKMSSMVCTKCGSLLGPITEFVRSNSTASTRKYCRICKTDDTVGEIDIPYIFKYLVTQLASCNISLRLKLKNV